MLFEILKIVTKQANFFPKM